MGGKTADQSRSNGGGSSGKKHGRDELKAKSSFEEYIDDGREYIVTSRSCLGGIDDDDFVEPNHPEVVLVTPPKESNQHRREVDDDDDFAEHLPRNPSGSSNPCKISHGIPSLRDVVDDDDFLDPVPASVAGSSNSSKFAQGIPHQREVVDDDDFVEDVPHVEGKTKEKKTWNDP